MPLTLHEAAKSPTAEAMLQGLLNAGHDGSHPVLAAAAHAYAEGAKDAALKIHQDIQTATSAPMLTSLQKQASMALSRANSMLQSAGSSLSSKDVNELYQQAAQAVHAAQLSQQLSGEKLIDQYWFFSVKFHDAMTNGEGGAYPGFR